jgi:hypothetical protein
MLLKGVDQMNAPDIVMRFLKTGGWKGTKIIHDHLKEQKISISRKRLLGILHTYAEPGDYVSIGGIRQKSWIA